MVAIEAQGLEKRYRSAFGRRVTVALAGVDLRVPRGGGFGLVGPNGAGKTTFVKALLGVVRPTAGTVRLLGGDPHDPRVRARVGYQPERLRFASALTPLELLGSVARLKGCRLARSAALALLEEVGLAAVASRRVGTFSKGMQQRVGLASALVGTPDLLVLDEPTDGLDPPGRAEVRALLARRIAAGATVLLNSHLLAETERICARVGILVAGRVVREGPLLEVTGGVAGLRGRWTARFAPGAPAEALAGAGFSSRGAERWSISADGPGPLNAALDRARAAGGLLLELTPEGQDLEAALVQAMAPGERR